MQTSTHELAWAAGFFDGEGTTYADKTHSIFVSVGQKHPALLYRFNDAIWNLGKVYGPYNNFYSLRIASFAKVQQVLALLWPYLGDEKREQARKALATTHLNKYEYQKCISLGHNVVRNRCLDCKNEGQRRRYRENKAGV